MRRVNRKIKRGTLGHRNDPTVQQYENVYHIGHGLVFRALTLFGDSKYTRDLCEYIRNRKNNEPNLSKYTFNELVQDFENGNHDIIIEEVDYE